MPHFLRRVDGAAKRGRSLACRGLAWAQYGADGASTLRRDGKSFNFSRHPVIGWHEPARIVAGDWIAAHVPVDRIVYRSNSLVNQLMAVRAGVGVALLPCYLADREPRVKRISAIFPDLTSGLWIVTHQDLKHTARIRAFLATVGDAIAAQRRVFEGQTPPHARQAAPEGI